ncbi:helix-hairpin-helix domain-containing protein [Rhodanobacter sp. MP7CTX1]|jgi:competence protein ComEA|uniref:ComEA family DNA-binding protein n=1 Tax=Rhodanobacter sp. MP7CTX1 TaxID=2723084 RepID=UPI00161C5B9E|nr:helix-hairpin-helix domain-containing protein [Rhodanobacter sp. MP7CTX1]MBB6188815.1 competence protein ComEA [Rhodanobacter sp. MP7CTX1]
MFKKLAVIAFALTLALPGWLLAATPVNINTADAATLAKSLDGIGNSKAQAIVAWRDAHGPFKSVDDLSQVKGFGPKTLERNRAAILLTGGPADPAAKADSKPAQSKPVSQKSSQKKSVAKTPAATEE